MKRQSITVTLILGFAFILSLTGLRLPFFHYGKCQAPTRVKSVFNDAYSEKPLLQKYEPVFWKLIEDSLWPFRGGISKEDVDAAFELSGVNGFYMYKVLIYENQLYVQSKPTARHQQARMTKMLQQLLCSYRVPNVEFVMSYNDGPVIHRASRLLPVFSWVRHLDYYDIPVPFPPAFANLPSTPADIQVEFDPVTWDLRDPRAIWRGSTTGSIYTAETWNTTTRSRLVLMCKARQDLCDAEFTRYINVDSNGIRLLTEAFGEPAPALTLRQQTKMYKHLIVVNGNGPPSSRSIAVLQSGALLLWQETEVSEFFYDGLRPYVHYIPVARSLDDLYSAIQWAQSNPDLCKQVIKNAISFAKRYFNRQFADRYLHDLLIEYHRLLKFVPNITSDYKHLALNNTCGKHAVGLQ